MAGTPRSDNVSTRLQLIAKRAEEAPERALTSLSHFIDETFLEEAFRRTRKDGAPGVDGQGAGEFAADLGSNLESLLNRFKSGSYRAPPVRRHHIPKGDGRTRPIGIPTFEDKVLQRAVTMTLEAVYETEFLDCSYGFRPGRSAHQAVESIWRGLMKMGGGFVIDADIKSFFDDLDHDHLRSFLDRRIRDGVVRRTINKWLKAGVMEEGRRSVPRDGTPQGGVVSPLLANVYLHEVLDRWFEETVRPLMRGRCFLVRYADDFVMAFEQEHDARRVLSVLGKRLGRFGLTLHPDKTRLLDFRSPVRRGPVDGPESLRSFDFLGFTHFWGRSRKGQWVVQRRTATSRFARSLQAIGQWLRANRHLPVAIQHEVLCRKLRGHDAYFGVIGNSRRLSSLRYWVARAWKKWLGRRSQRGQLSWERFTVLLEAYPLPPPRIVQRRQLRGANA